MSNHFFGTDGIRDTVGNGMFTHANLTQLGMALGQWITQRYGTHARIALAHDPRASSLFVASALQTGLLLHNIHIEYHAILPTPALCHYVQKSSSTVQCGIMISASHNPYQDNGIKIIDRAGKISAHDEQTICSNFTNITTPNYTTFGTISFGHTNQYADTIVSLFPDQLLAGLTIVLDCANGATAAIAPHLFAQLGARVIPIHNSPNGININNECGALHLHDLQKKVVTEQADIGFAFDGDGDRVIAVNKQGIIKDGDDLLALLLTHPHYRLSNTVVGTVMTNQGFNAYLDSRNITLIRTAVGDKYIAARLQQDNLLIGGEQSGHIILRDYLESGDGIFTALRVLETMIINNNWQLHTFEKFPQLLINVPITHKKDLSQEPLSAIINESKTQLHKGRLIVRYSGTENMLRIMIEDENGDHIKKIGTQLSRALQNILS